MNVLVRHLVHEETEPSNDASASSPVSVCPPLLRAATFAGTTSVTRTESQENIWEIAEKANEIPDGGEVAAALKQSSSDRSKSSEILRRSNEALNVPHSTEDGIPRSRASSVMPNTQQPSPPSSPTMGMLRLGDEMLTDHGLALALAALCNGLYQILDSDLAASQVPKQLLAADGTATMELQTGNAEAMYDEMVQKMSLVQNRRVDIDISTLSPEQQALWAEIDRLMVLVQTICSIRKQQPHQPPSYEEAMEMSKLDSKPAIKGRISSDELTQVLSAIDRVIRMAPRLDNQSVLLNARQEKVMSAAALTALIDRLNRGKENFQSQRAISTSQHRFAALQRLVDQITSAGERSLSNQRVSLSADQKDRMEIGRLGRVWDRQEKSRFKNQVYKLDCNTLGGIVIHMALIYQDYITREQRLLADLSKLHAELSKTESRKFAAQRYEVSTQKQRDMFMNGLGARVGRLEERRMSNQDALSVSARKEQKFEELEKMLDRMPAGLGMQRASPAMRKPSISRA